VCYVDAVKMTSVTLRLPNDLIREATEYAAKRDTTLSGFVNELLRTAVAGTERSRAAADRLLTLADRGPFSDVDPRLIRRDELHDR
jgi:hypothetical protein